MVTCEGVEVARHRRCLANHQTFLDPDHAGPLRKMRAARRPVAVLDPRSKTATSVYDQAMGVA